MAELKCTKCGYHEPVTAGSTKCMDCGSHMEEVKPVVVETVKVKTVEVKKQKKEILDVKSSK